MLLDRRTAVSTYLEVFLLVGVAIGGSGVVLGAGLSAASSTQGPGVSLADGSIRQGAYSATERVLVYNAGDAPFGSFVLDTDGVSTTTTYCYSVYDPAAGTVVLGTCPTLASDPAAVAVALTLNPGKGVLVVLTVTGSAFPTGTISRLVVTTSGGAQGSTDVEVLPA